MKHVLRTRNLGPKGRPVSGRPEPSRVWHINPKDIAAGPMTRLARIANRNAVRHTSSATRLRMIREERDAEIKLAGHDGGPGTVGSTPTRTVENESRGITGGTVKE